MGATEEVLHKMRQSRWAGHGDDWPEGHRPCVVCFKIKPFSEFHKHVRCKFGINTVCKSCRKPKSKVQWADKDIRIKILERTKSRSTKKGIVFDLSVDDIIIPETCPVFKTKFVVGDANLSPSIDRIDPNIGYVKNNVQIISNRANRIKSDATLEELRCLVEYLEKL